MCQKYLLYYLELEAEKEVIVGLALRGYNLKKI